MAKPLCVVKGCPKKALYKEWCRAHYLSWHRLGDPVAARSDFHDPEPKWALIASAARAIDDSCILWPYGCNGMGRPQINDKGQMRTVGQLVLETAGEPRPQSPYDNALHSCDNILCISKTHLRWGSIAENVHDYLTRGRYR